ncbi:hypothetical protein QBC38DRAFT_279840 [Podospora fimiseda]|uniref:Uncharacterized protein n=1 Tax=Podospora fimiseda TaxID=252190 RepID=A0AAN7BKN8_9PEZI|nr:hypothetical protein QBC38DRAFT_279840 [Podospora fimiseda]
MAITSAISDLISSIFELFSSFLGAAYTIIHSFFAAILSLFSGFFNFVADIFRGVFDVLGGVGNFLAGNIVFIGVIAALWFGYTQYVAKNPQARAKITNGAGAGTKKVN